MTERIATRTTRTIRRALHLVLVLFLSLTVCGSQTGSADTQETFTFHRITQESFRLATEKQLNLDSIIKEMITQTLLEQSLSNTSETELLNFLADVAQIEHEKRDEVGIYSSVQFVHRRISPNQSVVHFSFFLSDSAVAKLIQDGTSGPLARIIQTTYSIVIESQEGMVTGIRTNITYRGP